MGGAASMWAVRAVIIIVVVVACALGGGDSITAAVSAMAEPRRAAVLLAALAALLVSQGLRGVRLHLALAGFRPRPLQTMRMQLTASCLGHATIPLVQEASLLALYVQDRSGLAERGRPTVLPMVLAMMVTRLFDFLVIMPLVLALSSPITGYQAALVAVGLVLALALFVFPLAVERLERHALRAYHGPAGVALVTGAAGARAMFARMRITRPDALFVLVLLTLGGWGCELLSVMWAMDTELGGACQLLVSRITGPHALAGASVWLGVLLLGLGGSAVVLTTVMRKG